MSIKSKISKILNNKIYVDFLKIGLSVSFYIIVVSIFKAGYEYQSVIKVNTLKPEEKIKEFQYKIKLNDGKFSELKFQEEKNLFSLIDSYEKIEIEYVSYYEGKEITSINTSNNFKIILNNNEYDSRFFKNDEKNLPEDSVIEVYTNNANLK